MYKLLLTLKWIFMLKRQQITRTKWGCFKALSLSLEFPNANLQTFRSDITPTEDELLNKMNLQHAMDGFTCA